MPQEAWNEFSKWQQMKEVLAHESHTSAWLVSPAAGCEKKMEVSTTGPQTTKLSTLEHILVYTNSIVSGLA